MSIEEDIFLINAVPPFDFDEINEYYCWDGSDEDEILHDLDTMVCVEIEELNESLPLESNQDNSIIDCSINFNSKKFDPLNITMSQDLKKRYQCDICFRMYANTKTLTTHKKKHKKFKCEICNHEFNAKTPLNRHMAIFHKKTVPCDFCTTKCYTIQQLAEHLEMKHFKELNDEEQENINMEENTNIISQPKNSLDTELKLTLNAFFTKHNKKREESSYDLSERKNFSNYTSSSTDYFGSNSPKNYAPESSQYTPNSPKYTKSSPKCIPNSSKCTLNPPNSAPNSPQYTPKSHKYTPNSPKNTLNSPKYTASSPKYTPNSPKYTLNPPNCALNSPKYTPNSPKYTLNSPKHTASSPKYTPNSPTYNLGSPNYDLDNLISKCIPNSSNYAYDTPNSPKNIQISPKLDFKDVLSDLPEIKLPKKNLKSNRSWKQTKTMRDFLKVIHKHID